MGGENQLDAYGGQYRADILGLIGQPRLRTQRRALRARLVVLLGQIGQVQELVERTRHIRQIGIGQLCQAVAQILPGVAALGACALGQCADGLDLIHERRATLAGNRLAQPLAQQAHILAQARIQMFALTRRLAR